MGGVTYKLVTGLRTNGTASINLNYYAGPTTRIEIDCNLSIRKSNAASLSIFNAYTQSNAFRAGYASNIWGYFDWCWNDRHLWAWDVRTGHPSGNMTITFGYENGRLVYLTTSNKQYNDELKTATTTVPIYVGGDSTNGLGAAVMIIYEVRLYESDQLVRTYKPIDNGGVGGLVYNNSIICGPAQSGGSFDIID